MVFSTTLILIGLLGGGGVLIYAALYLFFYEASTLHGSVMSFIGGVVFVLAGGVLFMAGVGVGLPILLTSH